MKYFTISTLFYLCVSTTTQAMDVDAEESILAHDFMDIHQISQKLMQLCPIKKCVIVGIGQSPTPIIAYLETEHKKYAWSVPLSHFAHGVTMPHLLPKEEKKLYEHLEEFMPSPEDLGGRTIVLLDYASKSGGVSLLAVSHYIVEFLATIYQNIPEVKIAAIKENYHCERIPFSFNYIFLFNKNNKFIQNIKNNHYEDYSPFGMFHVTDLAEEARTTRPKYKQLRQQIELQKSMPMQYGYPGGPVPQYKLIQQPGILDASYKAPLGGEDLAWYANQLGYYRGNDDMDRFQALFSNHEGAQKLMERWQLFVLKPAQQDQLLGNIIASGDQKTFKELSLSLSDIAPQLQKDYLALLLKKGDEETRKLIIQHAPQACAEQMVGIVKKLHQDDSLKPAIDALLDNFLMPELIIGHQEFELLKRMIVSRFEEFCGDPATEKIALQKYQTYCKDRPLLPLIKLHIDDPGNNPPFHYIPIEGSQHKPLRDSILNRIGELWEDTSNEEMAVDEEENLSQE